MFLSLDHINGGGTKERNMTKIMGGRLYKKLQHEPVNPDLQVLCYNCNFAKGNRESCPHMYMDKVRIALDWKPKETVDKRQRK